MLYTLIVLAFSGSVDGGATSVTVPNLTHAACNAAAVEARKQAPRSAYNREPRVVILCIRQSPEKR